MPLQLRLFDAPEPPRSPGEVVVARGALAAEAMLLSRIDALLSEARKNPGLLARPVRIVVPSRSLRLHVASAIVRARGRSAAGVVIQTLHALAFEVLERAGEAAPRGMPLVDILAQRLARTEPALRRGLGDLVDGYGAVVGTVRDLLDAGMEPVHAEAADEALAADGSYAATRAEVERARALVRTAARTEALMQGIGLGRVSTLLRRAAEILAADPERALPSRAILVHGFADATGVATDLIQELLRLGAALILDHPPAGSGGAERAFTERFTERLAGVSRFAPAPPGDSPEPPRVERFEAVGSEAEVRELARRVRALLDGPQGGARPEGIGVVARDLSPYALPLRRHLHRLGVPFSGVGARGALEPAGRRARAFLELLRRGEEVPADRWLDAVGALSGAPLGGLLVDLRLAFYALGAGRLRDVADLRPETFLKNGRYALPIRQGLRASGAVESEVPEAEEGETYAARRTVEGRPLRAAVRTAGRVRERLVEWPDEDSASEHFRLLRALLVSDLGWEPGSGDAAPVLAALAELEREVPSDFPLTRDELRLLLSGSLAEAGTSELGGQGGGVQVLTVMEARGRTFEHLFVLGMNRDLFPRGVREDPLLPDGLRRVLRRVLPDVPVKGTGFDEERYLFAGLLAASPSVTLSWQSADDDGKALSPSPLLRGDREAEKAPPLYAPGGDRFRPADEHAVISALHGTRLLFSRVLPAALAEARAGLSAAAFDLRPEDLAAARVAVLDELDPDLRTPEGRAARSRLGPFFGFVGAVAAEADPRRTDLFVTSLEKLAGCPWQLFLGRLLRLEPTPDPLAALPGADPLLLGNLVHAALKRIVLSPLSLSTVETPRGASPPPEVPATSNGSLEMDGAAAGDAPRGVSTVGAVACRWEVPWPASADLDRILREEAERLLAEEGIFRVGLARALAERARPLVDVAGEMDWGREGAALSVLRAEEPESLTVRDAAGDLRTISFRADRVDRTPEGLRFTDYKTGRPISTARKPDVRRRHFLERVKQGTHLQAVAYLLAAGEPATGRYLFLRPGLGGEDRELAVTAEDRDFAEGFAGAAAAVLGAWDAGSFFPRVVDPAGRDEPGRCSWCAVAEACVRGDSGARLRLFEWTERAKSSADLDPAESALLRVWRLAARGGREEAAPEAEGEAKD